MPKATKKPLMAIDQLKKEDYLLVFMLNHEDSTSTPFKLNSDGDDFIYFKGTKDYKSLQSMLQTLKRKGVVVNGSRGNWHLTPAGVVEAEYWLSKCGHRRLKEITAASKAMATNTNQYLYEKNTELRKENMKLKKKLEMIQRVLNK